MTEAQKEYIILEGEIEEVFSFLDDAPEFTREIEGDIRSRPYKSEAVLEKALRVIKELIECDCVPNDFLHPDKTGCFCPPERDCHLCKMKVLAELQQAERER